MRPNEPHPPQRLVPSVDRAARMLGMLEEGSEPLSISELGRRLEASKGAVREVLETLRYHGLVERDDESKLYRLGSRLIRLGSLARSRVGLSEAARPHLRRLADESGETTLLLQIHGEHLVIQETVDPPQRRLPMSIVATPGASIPLLAGACGKVVLAYMEPAEIPLSEAAPIVTEGELEEIRSRFYALDDEEYFPGVRGVSAPILRGDADLAGLLLVSGLSGSLRAENLVSVGEAAATAARAISIALGGSFEKESAAVPEPSV